jgi:hypothetical protein
LKSLASGLFDETSALFNTFGHSFGKSVVYMNSIALPFPPNFSSYRLSMVEDVINQVSLYLIAPASNSDPVDCGTS